MGLLEGDLSSGRFSKNFSIIKLKEVKWTFHGFHYTYAYMQD